MCRHKHILASLSLAIIGFSSCSLEEPRDVNKFPEPLPLAIDAPISGNHKTRAERNETGTADEWSYLDFVVGDEMGLFASGGKFDGDNYGEAPFINQKLTYTGGTGEANFRDSEGSEFSPTHMNGDEIYMYFPYTEDITSDKGFVLRTYTGVDGLPLDTARCVDFLSTNKLEIYDEVVSPKAALYGEFQHTFAELIIMRGEGFDNPPEIPGENQWEIKAVLNTPITGIKAVVTTEGGKWKCAPEFVFDDTSMTSAEASTWQAWLGANYFKTQEDKIGQNAWYVIVPTIGCQAKYVAPREGIRTTVEYIELYDNDGNLQRVSSLLLSNGNSKYVDGGWRYPMEISMKELVPTANPCQIVPWGDEIDLTDERKRGINNETEFAYWVQAYNAYLDSPDQEHSDALLQYGDLYINPDGSQFWHFYVLNDLNLSSYKDSPIVNRLEDILDGQSTVYSNGKFQNHRITGLTQTFFGEMTGANAMVQNFTFVNPQVTYSESYTTPTGIITSTLTGGATVNNCRIQNGSLYCPSAPGGMVAGSVNDGTIEDCVLSGFLVAASTHDHIVGEVTGNYNSVNNNASNVTNESPDDDGM